MNKGIVHLFLPLILVVTLIAGSLYFYTTTKSENTEQSDTQNNEESVEENTSDTSEIESKSNTTPTIGNQQKNNSITPSPQNNESSTSTNQNTKTTTNPPSSPTNTPTIKPVYTATSTPIPTATPTQTSNSGTVSLSTKSVSVTLSRSQASGGFVYGNGYDFVNGTGQTVTFCVYNTSGAQGVGFQQSSGAVPGNSSLSNKTYINASKPNGMYTGTVSVKYGNGCTTQLGDVTYSITLTD